MPSLADVEPVAASSSADSSAELGTTRAGDANDDNVVNMTDFSILKNTHGRMLGIPGYDARADFTGDNVVSNVDFAFLRLNFGQSGAPPLGPSGP